MILLRARTDRGGFVYTAAIETPRSLPLLLCLALVAGCESLPGFEKPATPAPTATAVAVIPIPTAEESPPEETPPPTNTPVVMETPVKTARPRGTSAGFVEEAPTPKPVKTPRTRATAETVDLAEETPDAFVETPPPPEPTPEATPDEPVASEVKVASISFTPGSNVSLLKIDATTNGGQTVVSVQLSGAGNYKILPLPNRRQVWIDLETVELTEPKTFPGSGSSLVKEISARSFERGLVRVIVQLKDDGNAFPVIGPKKRSGEAASVEVKIGPDPEP